MRFHNLITALTLWAIIIACGACFSAFADGAEVAPGFSLDFLRNPEVLNAVAGLAVVLYGLFKSSDWMQSRRGLKQAAFIALAERAVAWQWHNYLRDATDQVKNLRNAAASTFTPPVVTQGLIEVQHRAHNSAVALMINEAPKLGLESHPAIVAAKRGATNELDAAVVTAVKRFKAGTAGIHTGPTTKGA